MNPNAPLGSIPELLGGLSPKERDALIRQLSEKGAPADRVGSGDPGLDQSAGVTEIVCVVDRSGSMGAIRDDAIGGFNQFLNEQRGLPGEARLTLALFDHEYDLVCDAVPVADARPLDEATYMPRGTTALFDAVGRTLDSVGRRLGKAPTEPGVIVCILTDGMENASTDYTAEAVRALIEARREAGWAFVFLAADQDAIQAARSLSIAAADAAAFAATGTGVREAYARMSMRTRNIRLGRERTG